MAWIYIPIIIVSCLLLHRIFSKRKILSGIPGPKQTPIFGNLFQLESKRLYLQFAKWATEYGPVFGLDLAGTPAVVVSGREALYEVLIRHGSDFSGRMHSFRNDAYPSFMAFSDLTPILSNEKKLMMSHVKAYGAGIKVLEKIIMSKIDVLINNLEDVCGNGSAILKIDDLITDCVARISGIIIFGHEVDDEDISDMIRTTKDMDCATQPSSTGLMLDIFPVLRFLGHPYWHMIKTTLKSIDNMYQRAKKRIKTQKKHGMDMTTNFLSKYIDMYEGKNNLGITEVNCRMSWFMAFVAALNTTSNTMNVLISNLIVHPHVQDKLRQESDHVLKGRKVTVTDRSDMPYHHAVILEITRMLPILPMLIPHSAICDTEILGYKIPKGTILFNNIWALHHDENIWDKPFVFNPERYLSDEGKLVPADHPARVNHLAFSAGPRVCAGEGMATVRMFLIMATLIQKFEFLPATCIEDQPPCGCFDMMEGFVLKPQPYTVRLKPRNIDN